MKSLFWIKDGNMIIYIILDSDEYEGQGKPKAAFYKKEDAELYVKNNNEFYEIIELELK